MGLIYAIKNKINNKRYVGTTKRNITHRKSEHKRDALIKNKNMLIHKAIREFGWDNFHFIILEKTNDLENREKFWIKKLNTISPHGYNETVGGFHLFGIENLFFNKHHSKETKEKISVSNYGRVHSPEEIEKRKIINSGNKNPFYNKRHTEETKGKLRAMKQKNNITAKNDDVELFFETMSDAVNFVFEKSLCRTTKYRTVSDFISLSIKDNRMAYGYYWK